MEAKDDAQRHDWTGVGALSLGWALSFSVVTASITASNLAGRQFSPGAAFNTVPLAVLLISLSAWSFALPRLFEAFGGRLSVYRITSAVGMVASVVAAVACASRSFAALCIASAMFGLPSAAGQTFRFAALSMVPKSSHPKCIGAVLTGGIVGALVGPSYAAGSTDLFPDAKYAGVYLCTGVAFLGILIIMLIPGLVTFHAEHDTAEEDRADARDDARDDAHDSPPMLPMDSTESEVWMWCVALCFAMAATAFSPVSGGICDTTSGVAPLARPKRDKTDPAAKSATALAPSALAAGPRSTCTFWRSRRSLILLDR